MIHDEDEDMLRMRRMMRLMMLMTTREMILVTMMMGRARSDQGEPKRYHEPNALIHWRYVADGP